MARPAAARALASPRTWPTSALAMPPSRCRCRCNIRMMNSTFITTGALSLCRSLPLQVQFPHAEPFPHCQTANGGLETLLCLPEQHCASFSALLSLDTALKAHERVLWNLPNIIQAALLPQSDLAEGGKAGAFVSAPQGLFPAALPPTRQGSRLLPRFTLLGRAAAKALQDGRMLDVPLSYTFYRCSFGQELKLLDT